MNHVLNSAATAFFQLIHIVLDVYMWVVIASAVLIWLTAFKVIDKDKRGGPVQHYVLATLPKTMSCKQLVGRIKQRWRTERVYEDLKGELGLDHFEGRTYTGWQHHVSCVLSCYAFLVALAPCGRAFALARKAGLLRAACTCRRWPAVGGR